tara:strand:- start:128 stop:277 length:150 start_codon:yes stop_codon:yes gene_type:complete
MGNIVNWIIALPIIGLGLYLLVKGIKKEVKGEGCPGCSESCNMDDCGCK